MELNPEQKRASEVLYGIALVNAVPGSGKTLTMTQRICNLIRKHNISSSSILGVTFTRNAAQAIRKRLQVLLAEDADQVLLTTLHSFCYTLLKKEGKVFELLQGGEQISFLREILREKRYKAITPGFVLSEISLAKNHLISPEEYWVLHEGDLILHRVGEVYQEYEQKKRKMALLDFDDLLVEAHALLYTKIERRQEVQETYWHVLVDEFQDTNIAQWEVLQLLLDRQNMENRSLWVCGDDWQGIYGFNGASLSLILRFQEQFPQSQLFILQENYRSTPQILRACQNLIAHNQRKMEKTLITQNPDGDEILVLECENEEDEALQVVTEIQYLIEKSGIPHRDMAVLYRANFQSRVLEEAFSKRNIPYFIQNGVNFYQRKEVKYLLDYLQFIQNPNCNEGDEALKCILNVPNRYIGKKFIQELEEYSLEQGGHLYQSLKAFPVSLPYLRHKVKEFFFLMDPLLLETNQWEPREILQVLRDILDYDRFIAEEEVISPDNEIIANLDQLELSAARFSTLPDFLDYTRSFVNQNQGKNEQGVKLMTIHKAKGLEFSTIFLVGLVEGILPTKNGDTEEERRICFVGISRAMQLLYLSYTRKYLGQSSKKSLFLDEILGQVPQNATASLPV